MMSLFKDIVTGWRMIGKGMLPALPVRPVTRQPLSRQGSFSDLDLALKSTLGQLLLTAQDLPTSRELTELYQTSVAVYRAANKQANAVAQVPMRVKAGDQDAGDDHPLVRLLSARLAYQELIRRTDLTLSFWGANLLEKQRQLSRKLERLRWVNPNLWQREVDVYQGLTGFWVQDQFGAYQRFLPVESAVYQHLVDFRDDFGGIAPAEVAYNFGAVHPELAQTMLATFRNRAVPALLIQPAADSGTDLAEETPGSGAAQKLMRYLRGTIQGSANAGRTVVSPDRWEVIQLLQSFEHLRVGEVDDRIIQNVAMAWDMPASLLVMGASNFAEKETDRREWWQGTIVPLCRWHAMHLTEHVATEYGDDLTVEPDFSDIAALKEDEAAKTTTVITQLRGAAITMARAQEKLGEEPDKALEGVYLLNGEPITAEALRKKAQRKEEEADRPLPDAFTVGEGNDKEDEDADQDEQEEKPDDEEEEEEPEEGDEAKHLTRIPNKAWREFRNWQRLLEAGDGQGFTCEAIPGDVAAYVRLHLATGDEATAAIEAGKAYWRGLDTEAAKDFNQTAMLYRAALYNLIASAFEVDWQTGESMVSRGQFGEAGRAEIATAFRAAFLQGLEDGGGSADEVSEEADKRLKLEIDAERKRWTALANELYRRALPLYRRYLALAETARHAPTEAERQDLREQAWRKLGEFQKEWGKFLDRVDLWVNKGLTRLYHLGQMSGQQNRKKKWRMDPAKENCRTCQAADDQVHTEEKWLAYGITPQGDNLICGGWLCGCRTLDTDEKARGRLDRIPLRHAGSKSLRDIPVAAKALAADGAIDFGFAVSFANDPVLKALVERLAEGARDTGIAWESPYDWHLSLVYAAEPQPIQTALAFLDDPILAEQQAIPIQVTHLEVWEAPDGGRALVGIVEAAAELRAMQAALHEQLASRGIAVNAFTEPDAWQPHVTLAYESTETAPELPASLALSVDNVCLTTPDFVLLHWSSEVASEGEEHALQHA